MTGLTLPGRTGSDHETPVVREHRFEGREGLVSLRQLFGRCKRLAIYHAMPDHSGPGDFADPAELSAALRDGGTRLVLASRAPYAKLQQYCRHFGGNLTAYSASEDFFTTFAASRRVTGFAGELWDDEVHGLSIFRRERAAVVHTGSVAVPLTELLGILGFPDRVTHHHAG
jgi:predicted dithiol-disulfide oxidoreductase (DUF899 family)